MMSEDTMDMRDEDRLPWLEAVEENDEAGLGIGKLVVGILAALLVIALVIGGIFWLRDRNAAEGDGAELIAAPEQDYRVRPSEVGGMEVEGEGDAAFATSEGESPEGRINRSATPEEPVRGRQVAATAGENSGNNARGEAAGSASARIPASGGRLADAAPRQANSGDGGATASAASGRLIQLGAFSSQASANSAWSAIAGRQDFLSSLNKSITSVEAGGRTLYRLRVDAGSAEAARSLCSRLRNASEACSVVVN